MRYFLSIIFWLFWSANASAIDGVELYGSDHFGTVVVIPTNEQTEVAVNLIIATGAAEDEVFEGLAHFAEHRSFVGAIQASGYRGSFNAFTTLKTTEFATEVDPGSLGSVVRFLRATLSNHDIPDAAFEIERNRILREIDIASNGPARRREYCAARKIIFANSPWFNCVIGQRDIINALSLDKVRTFQSIHYTADKSILVIAGPVDVASVQKLVPSTGNARWAGTPLENPAVNDIGSILRTSTSSRLFLGFQSIKLSEPLLPATQSALVLFASIWSLDQIEVALSASLTGDAFIVRDFTVLVEPTGPSMAFVSIAAELERGMIPESARSAIVTAISNLREPGRESLSAKRSALAAQVAQPLVYHQLLLTHVRNRRAALSPADLTDAVSTVPIDAIRAFNRTVLSPGAWRFVTSG